MAASLPPKSGAYLEPVHGELTDCLPFGGSFDLDNAPACQLLTGSSRRFQGMYGPECSEGELLYRGEASQVSNQLGTTMRIEATSLRCTIWAVVLGPGLFNDANIWTPERK